MDNFYFILDEKYQAYWRLTNNQPNTYLFKYGSKKLNKTFHLVNVSINQNDFTVINKSTYSNFHVPMLKSLLQKTIRRQMTELALKTAKTYLTIDPIGFLRRLLIISCEDVFLCSTYTHTIVWFYIAVKLGQYSLCQKDCDFLMSYVESLCIESRYIRPMTYTPSSNNKKIVNKYTFKRDSEAVAMILSLELFYVNTQFHLTGDNNMFLNVINTTTDKTTFNKLNVCIQSNFYENIQFMKFSDYDPIGIDFHNFPFIIKYVNKSIITHFPNLSEEELNDEIRQCIWHCRSGINLRKQDEHTQKYSKMYEIIESPLNKICRMIISQRLI